MVAKKTPGVRCRRTRSWTCRPAPVVAALLVLALGGAGDGGDAHSAPAVDPSVTIERPLQAPRRGCGRRLPPRGVRDDVLVIVNRNSRSSCDVAEHYAAARGLGRNALVEVSTPAAYFIDWPQFENLRDQLLAHLAAYTLTDRSIVVDDCNGDGSPIYCPAAVDTVRAYTRIRYLVTTRGVPTRVLVDDSSLPFPETTSVDNYLRHWLVHYFATDAAFDFPNRAIAFGDGRGMRLVDPATDHELIIGRIDGLTASAATALVDRTLDAEAGGLFGKLIGSQFDAYGESGRWLRFDTAVPEPIYGDATTGWKIQLGFFGESRAACIDYLAHAPNSIEGRAPEFCRTRLTDGDDPGPSAHNGRIPTVHDALIYLGSLDGASSAAGRFDDVLDWRRDPGCEVALCDDADDPEACRAASEDVFGEINTDCVGVADGFIGYNLQSYPVSYLAAWPTGWRGPTGGSRDGLGFVHLRHGTGAGDTVSAWFDADDEIDAPTCFATGQVDGTPTEACPASRHVWLRQAVDVAPLTIGPAGPPAFRVLLAYASDAIATGTVLRVKLMAGAYGDMIGYPAVELVTLSGTADWQTTETTITLDPALHVDHGGVVDGLELQISSDEFTGALGLDAVSLVALADGTELLANGDFADGHRSVSNGDYAATFLSRLGGVAFWGSQSHHGSAGFSFSKHAVTSLAWFLRGLPLGDAVWFAEYFNSGVLYGDPLYSPVAVRLDYHNPFDWVTGAVPIEGAAINGHDPARVTTTHELCYCPGDDFAVCDADGSWLPTGVVGDGGVGALGTWQTTGLSPGVYTLRLGVHSTSPDDGATQSLYDYQVVTVYDPAADDDGDGLANHVELTVHGFDPTTADMDDDGLVDGAEVSAGTDPYAADTDGDGMNDGYEVFSNLDPHTDDAMLDSDGDGLSNIDESVYGSNAGLVDTDGDTLSDPFEINVLGTNPAEADSDTDALDDFTEHAVTGTDPNLPDTDVDGMPDGYEWTFGLDPTATDGRDDADGDGADNVVEYLRGTDPLAPGSVPALSAFHVDAAAPTGGNGSVSAPLSILADALALASPGDSILLAPGRYALAQGAIIGRDVRIAGIAPGVIVEPGDLVVDGVLWGGLENLAVETWRSVRLSGTRNFRFDAVTLTTGNGSFLTDDARARFANVSFVNWGAVTALTLEDTTQADFANVTIAGFVVGIKIAGDAFASLRNVILDNSVDLDADADDVDAVYTLSGVGWLAGNDGNVFGDPSFRNAWWGDFRLLPWSAGIDAGDPADDWSREPAPNGCRVNMGAFGNTANAATSVNC